MDYEKEIGENFGKFNSLFCLPPNFLSKIWSLLHIFLSDCLNLNVKDMTFELI